MKGSGAPLPFGKRLKEHSESVTDGVKRPEMNVGKSRTFESIAGVILICLNCIKQLRIPQNEYADCKRETSPLEENKSQL